MPSGLPAAPAPVPQAPPAPVENRSYSSPAPPADTTWHPPANAGVQLEGPQASSPEPPREGVRLYAPEPPPASEAPRPGVTEDRTRQPSLPVGIPQFASVREGVSSGLKPLVDGGLDWLQANGYRTVLHVHLPGQDDSADRQQVEKHRMTYLSLEVLPRTLSQATVEQFTRIVNDPANRPLFVYDRDGDLAGGLWYLYFRTAEKATDESARARAARLGLKEDQEGAHRDMWLAIQKLLSTMTGDR
jgi:hypothetical protein